jgi:hypothetical protein
MTWVASTAKPFNACAQGPYVFGHKIIKKLGKDLWPAHTEGSEGSWMVVLLVTVAKYYTKEDFKFSISCLWLGDRV